MAKGFLDGYKTYDTSKGFGDPKKWQNAFRQRIGKDEAQAIMNTQSKSPHEVLGVLQNASPQDIKRAFRKLMMEWHPDRNQHREGEAEQQSILIIAAYEMLTSK